MDAKRGLTWVIGAVVAAVVLVVGGTFVYLRFIRDDAPPPLSLADVTTTTVAGAAPAPPTTAPAAGAGIDGTWQVGPGSQAGYRVPEVLFGQSAEAVGRTTAVTGQAEASGTTVASASFTVDLTQVTSDSSQRDGQFRGRIMDVATHPTATFTLTDPIQLGALPAEGEAVPVRATGDLTLRGTTRSATFDLQARLAGGTVQVAGATPITFADYGIPNPTFGPASVGDQGQLEVALVLTRS